VQDFPRVRITKAGGRVALQLNVDPIDVEGEAYLLTSVRDVTRAISVADELRALVDNLPELAWTARPDGFIDFYNRRWYEYTGATLEDMRGWGWQSVHDPIELPRVMESWIRSIATQQPFDQTFPLRRKDGVFRWFLTRVAPMFDGAGNLIRIFRLFFTTKSAGVGTGLSPAWSTNFARPPSKTALPFPRLRI